jgi:ABC-2 type transport system ATP-binding protein
MDCRTDRVKVLERVGFVSDRPLLGGRTGEQLVRFNRGFYPRWSDELVKRYVRVFDIPMKQKFRNLSRGDQTKMWLLLALAQRGLSFAGILLLFVWLVSWRGRGRP